MELGIILHENAQVLNLLEDNPMFQQELSWFFCFFQHEFRHGKLPAFHLIMFLALAHFFGLYNPKELADFLGIPHQQLYTKLKEWSLYYLKEMLLRFMVKQASEHLKPVLQKSGATQSRAGLTLSVDNSVIDRIGKMLRCTWSWYSGRWKKVVYGQDLLGIVLTINGRVLPLHLLFCSKQGRANTDKPTLLIAMFSTLKEAFEHEGIDLTQLPITMDSWFVSQELRDKLALLGFTKIIIAGKSNYTFTINHKKHKASEWKKEIILHNPQWGIEVPSCRLKAHSPTFGHIALFFYKQSTTRNYYLMDFSQTPRRGAQIWHVWKQHHLIECFWKLLKSVLYIHSMHLQGNGLYTALLIKVLAYLLALRLQNHKEFANFSLIQIMRKLRRDYDLPILMTEHFQLPILLT